MIIRKCTTIIFFCLLIFPIQISSQVSFSRNHSELKWKIIETDHFKIIYHQGIENIAHRVAQIAEQVYGPITTDLGVEPPQKTPIVVTDYLDYSNGLSTPLGHHILLWTQSYTKYTTGNLKWLQALVAHEFTHMVNFWAFRASPGFWRELFALGMIPTWFLEGLAEYEAEPWCTHRDMLLRVVTYSQKILPYKKMTGFIGADAIDARLVYEQGHSLVRYIVSRFGFEKIQLIIQNYRSLPISFNLALKRSLGISEKQLFSDWKKEVQDSYSHVSQKRIPLSQTNKKLNTGLQANFGARWSPDGGKIAVVGIKKYQAHVRELYVLDIVSNKINKIASPSINSFFSWSSNGEFLVYSQKHVVNNGCDINDLFLWDSKSRHIKRLTTNERAIDPHVSSDNRCIVYAIHQGAMSNLAILDLKTHKRKIITNFPEWTEVFTPQWSPDGKQIVFSIFDDKGNRDICIINEDGSNFKKITNHPEDDRYPAWSPDGKQIAFVSYRTGIPNLFLKNLNPGKIRQLTNTPGGVFNPAWLPDGKSIAVIAFEERDKTDIVIIPADSYLKFPDQTEVYSGLDFHAEKQLVILNTASTQSQTEFNLNSTPYQSFGQIRSQILLPYADRSEKGWQLGAVNLCADPLEKHSLLTSLTYGNRLHYSLDYINRQLNPTIELILNKTTVDHGNFLRVGENENLPLYENFYTGSLRLYWNINFSKSNLSNHILWLRQTITYRNSINYSDYEKKNIAHWALPFQGWINYLSLGYAWQTYRPDVSFEIHPKSGFNLSLYGYIADSWLKSDLKFSQLNLFGVIRRETFFSGHVIALRVGGILRNGEQPLQGRLAIGNKTIRGLKYSIEGDRQIFSNLEYRFPLIKDLGLKIWILYFEQFCGAFFLDSGKAWGSNFRTFYDGYITKYSSTDWIHTVGFELRHRFYIFGKIPLVVSGGYGINISDNEEQNYYFRIGQIF
jgi:Tol biopolymer transport system component